ncbi:MAG: DUF4194 domain-containing protein [Planctomycetaceae bacterium]
MSNTSEQQDSTAEAMQREPWSAAAVKLLQGVVYHDDAGDVWNTILANQSPLREHFGKLGVTLVVDEEDGMCWLNQPESDELPGDFQSMPRLFRTATLGFEATLLCVLLRDELRRSEEEDFHNERCVVRQSDLLETWQMFFPQDSDAVRMNRTLATLLGRLEKLKFVRRFEKEPPTWEIRRILRARLPLEKLQSIRDSLQEELERRRS